MMNANAIRQAFLDFFQSKGHQILPSAPIVVKNDPTLLFTNAGMNPFKDIFLGNRKPEYSRVADTQKCLRVSGKHNDLEEVGVDTYHHTMFEMLGNWSFGDYFKTEAIAWSWELLTSVYKIPQDRLYVTIFEGDAQENLPKDDEAFSEWKKWIASERILLGTKKDNFWEMGDTGPCGPCTEIHVDCRPDAERNSVPGHQLVNADHPQVIEIWNNVFIQFNRLKGGRLEPLPARHVDTGMGFERLVRVLQNKSSNYDTDIFTGTIAAIEKIAAQRYRAEANPGDGAEWNKAVAFRVLSDHLRAIGFTIADGQLPSNTGAGYVIRRILRRAVRYYYSNLQYKQPLLYQLIPQLADQFSHVFPELKQQVDFVSKVVKEEEEAFLRTLDKGLKRIDEMLSELRAQKQAGGSIPGKEAFELYDTYGFPLDLTKLIAHENKVEVDEAGFEVEMKKQKERSKAATAIDTEDWVMLNENAMQKFVGYGNIEAETRLSKYRKVKSKGRESFQLVLEQSPFYAESGGQVGDTGVLQFDGEKIPVLDTRKENDLIIVFTDKLPSNPDASVVAKVNRELRHNTALHHSATHLLHAALRMVLGVHVTQKGSLVNADYLRFDFSHFAKMTKEELQKVETLVNEKIRENIPVVIKQMKKEEAMALGAMALFGEKYGDTVRVVIIDPEYSIELCGGTHVAATGELGHFVIAHESAVAAGVRRIEAFSGRAADDFVNEKLEELRNIQDQLKSPKDSAKAIESLLSENAQLKKNEEKHEGRALVETRDRLLNQVQKIGGINFIGARVELGNADQLKKLSQELKSKLNDFVVVLTADIQGKAQVAISLDESLVSSRNLDASKIIKEQIAPLIKGGGGGQKSLATAGGQDVTRLAEVIEAVRALIG